MIVKCLQEVFWQNFEFFETYEQVSVHFTLNSPPCTMKRELILFHTCLVFKFGTKISLFENNINENSTSQKKKYKTVCASGGIGFLKKFPIITFFVKKCQIQAAFFETLVITCVFLSKLKCFSVASNGL